MLKGIIPAIVTPFNEDEEIDYSALEELLEFLIERRVSGVFVSGTNGEGPLLSEEERESLFKKTVKIVNGRIPVIAQIGSITTRETISLGKKAIDVGVNAVAIVSPYYFKLDDSSLMLHFTKVAKALNPFPTYLYNLPSNTGNIIRPEIVKLIKEENNNLKGIKDTSEDLQVLEEFIYILSSNMDILVGTDSLILPALVMGASGAISALANCLPELCTDIYYDFLNSSWEKAKRKQLLLSRVKTVIGQMYPISALKAILKYRGIMVGKTRSPLGVLSSEQEKILKELTEDVKQSYLLLRG